MKLQHLCSGLVIALLVSTAAGVADDKKKEGQPDQKKIEAAFKEYAKVGKHHQHFKRLVGRWNAEIVSYEDPSKKPQTSKGSSNIRLLLGGRFMQHNFRGSFGGQSFQGIGITGYDNAQKKYVGSWMDNMGTGIMRTEGKYDVKTNTLTETGTAVSPIGPMKFRMVSKFLDKDKYTFTMYMIAGEKENKMMEITYTRAAGKGKKGRKRKGKNAK